MEQIILKRNTINYKLVSWIYKVNSDCFPWGCHYVWLSIFTWLLLPLIILVKLVILSFIWINKQNTIQ